MEVRTTVRNFADEMTAHHISFDTRIRVIIDDPQIRRESVPPHSSPGTPSMTPYEQRQRLNTLPHEYDPQASDELIAIIEISHLNTDLLEL